MQAAIASSSISPYMWMCSGPRSTTPLDGEGIEARFNTRTVPQRLLFRALLGKAQPYARASRLNGKCPALWKLVAARPEDTGRAAAERQLEEDLDRGLRRTAALDELDRQMQVDVSLARELDRIVVSVPAALELLGAPALDPLAFGFDVEVKLCRRHLVPFRCRLYPNVRRKRRIGSPPSGGLPNRPIGPSSETEKP